MNFSLRKLSHLRFFLPLIILSIFIVPKVSFTQSAYETTLLMFEKTKEIKTITYTMVKKERIEGELLEQESDVKLCRDPFQVYSIQKRPEEGIEVLYCEGKESNKALINPSGFPWITLKLDPLGSIMRNNQHHTILNSGYDHLVSILEKLFDKYGEETKSMVSKHAPVEWEGIPCYSIEFNNPHFKFIEYEIKEGEDLNSISGREKISEHMILEKNESIDDYDDVEPGQIILVPNDYSPRLLIYIDKVRLIPLMMQVHDDNGHYEIFEYYNVKLDPVFKEDEFSEDFEEYGF